MATATAVKAIQKETITMQKRTILGILSAATMLALALPAAAQSGSVPAADKDFMMKAAQGGQAEVALGALAQHRGKSAGVKEFGQKMVTDHSKANAALMRVAAKKNISLPDAPGPEDQATKARLSALSGGAFDKAYVSDMVEDHVKDIADFTKEATTGKDPATRAFAAKTLPMLKMHLRMARALHGAQR